MKKDPEEIDSLINSKKNRTELKELYESKVGTAYFDARVFNLPKEEVANELYWRQSDASKNSVSQLAQMYFSHKELDGKTTAQRQDMLMLQKGINWNNLPTRLKRGTCCLKKMDEEKERMKWYLDTEAPIFSKNLDYINNRVYFKKEGETDKC